MEKKSFKVGLEGFVKLFGALPNPTVFGVHASSSLPNYDQGWESDWQHNVVLTSGLLDKARLK